MEIARQLRQGTLRAKYGVDKVSNSNVSGCYAVADIGSLAADTAAVDLFLIYIFKILCRFGMLYIAQTWRATGRARWSTT